MLSAMTLFSRFRVFADLTRIPWPEVPLMVQLATVASPAGELMSIAPPPEKGAGLSAVLLLKVQLVTNREPSEWAIPPPKVDVLLVKVQPVTDSVPNRALAIPPPPSFFAELRLKVQLVTDSKSPLFRMAPPAANA